MENVPQIRGLIDALSNSIDNLENRLEPLLSKDLKSLALSYDDPVDRANLYALFAYTLSSVLFCKLKNNNVLLALK